MCLDAIQNFSTNIVGFENLIIQLFVNYGYRFNLILDLTFLNNIKKENKDKRKEQNKRYRKKYKELLNLKKQRSYHQDNLEKKVADK